MDRIITIGVRFRGFMMGKIMSTINIIDVIIIILYSQIFTFLLFIIDFFYAFFLSRNNSRMLL